MRVLPWRPAKAGLARNRLCKVTEKFLSTIYFVYFCSKIKQIKDMRRYIRLLLCICALAVATIAGAQAVKWQDLYTVKKKDTIYGIAKKYNITIDELMKANPDMQKPDYTLKKGDQLLIPFSAQPQAPASAPASASKTAASATASKREAGTINVGVMLPLHNADGDGQRMIEYYRGLLMACDSLKAQGISTRVHAWNVPIDANVPITLADPEAAKCDIIFGPLYTTQVKEIGNFCRKNGIKLVIPFSINGNDVATNDHIFQVYQSSEQLTAAAVNAFAERFRGCNVVVIDCNDKTSNKGPFTSALRARLDKEGITCNITNLKSSEEMFAKAFSATKRNVVVLNTGRSPELNVTLAKLDGMKVSRPSLQISLYGYTEWLMYTKVYPDYYHKYDAYIPTSFFYNPVASRTASLERSYRGWFKSDMRLALPRFAITGYDHGQFFLRGMHRYGSAFVGSKQQSGYAPVQTPLKFKRLPGGGMQNMSFMLVHYKTNHTLESISY